MVANAPRKYFREKPSESFHVYGTSKIKLLFSVFLCVRENHKNGKAVWSRETDVTAHAYFWAHFCLNFLE